MVKSSNSFNLQVHATQSLWILKFEKFYLASLLQFMIKLPATNCGSSYCFRHWHENPRNVSSARKGSYPIIIVHHYGIFMLLNMAYSFKLIFGFLVYSFHLWLIWNNVSSFNKTFRFNLYLIPTNKALKPPGNE